jgi:ADP-ribosylation factor family
LLQSDDLSHVPFLILGNKIDLGRAASEEELRHNLGLYETYGKEVNFEFFLHLYIVLIHYLYLFNISQKGTGNQILDPLSFTCAL